MSKIIITSGGLSKTQIEFVVTVKSYNGKCYDFILVGELPDNLMFGQPVLVAAQGWCGFFAGIKRQQLSEIIHHKMTEILNTSEFDEEHMEVLDD